MRIDSYKFSLLSQHSYIHYILCKCMNQSFQEFNLIFMQFSIGKKFKKINSKFGFQKRKPYFGFKTENRISGFRLTSLLLRKKTEQTTSTIITALLYDA